MPLRQKPGTPSLLRELNDRAALELLLAEGPLTRAQLSERTGVSKVTVSQMLARLEERALVMIAGEQAGGRGPNAALYSVIPSSAYVAGLYVDFDLVSVAIADVAGNQVAEVSMDPHGGDDPVGLVREAIGQACANAGISLETLSAVVIGSPGVLDPRTGAPRLAVNLPTWQEGVLDGLREVLHTPVLIENDVNLAAMAERAGGTAAGLDDFAFVWLGTGLGLASVIGGQVRKGHRRRGGRDRLDAGARRAAPGRQRASGQGRAAGAGRRPGGAGAGRAARVRRRHPGRRRRRGGGRRGRRGRPQRLGRPGSAGAAFLDDLAQRVSIGVAAVCVVLDPGLVVLGGPVGKAGGSALATRVAAEVPRICLARPAVAPTTAADEPVLRGALQAALAQARAGLLGSLGSPSEIPA